jgi:iron transport multicopper oxidase
MAPRLLRNVALALAATFFSLVSADTRTYDFNVTWVNANPDGQQERRVQGINGQWPIPTIYADVGDQVVVNLYNGLGNAAASLHFHGLYQNGSSHMDGVGQGTQCPIPPGSTFTYNFTIIQAGTYWYHSHIDGQYPDGLRGALIINDPENPYKNLYDEELILTLSDWYHDEMSVLRDRFLSVANPTGAEPGEHAQKAI